jgi:serine/threonine-protein kinase SRPK3
MSNETWIGKTLNSKTDEYVIAFKIGSGSYASVWVSYSKNMKKFMAIKMFKSNEQKTGKKELEIYKDFKHKNIRNVINLHESFIYDDRLCIVIDLMVGSLYDLIKKGTMINPMDSDDLKNFKHGFDVEFVIKSIKTMLETLSDLHLNHIVHGDIKPDNILLSGISPELSSLSQKLSNKSSTKRISEEIKKTVKPMLSDYEIDDNKENTIDSENSCSESESESENGSESESESESKNQDNDDENSVMSEDPSLIILDDTDTMDQNTIDPDIVSMLNQEDNDSKINIVDQYIIDPVFKLSDMGSCVYLSETNNPRFIQTKYYRSPEIILGIKYDQSCDMWALGCTIYELLTGKILFDPDESQIDQKRTLLKLMCDNLGSIPDEMKNISPLKQIFFTNSGILKIDHTLEHQKLEPQKQKIWIDLFESINASTIIKYLIIDLIMEMLSIDPLKRISSKDALNHPLFHYNNY